MLCIQRCIQHLPLIILLLSISTLSSCGAPDNSTASVVTGSSGSVDVAALEFEAPELKELFQTFDRVARDATTETGWKHRDYSGGGNFVSAVWALGKGYDEECNLSRDPHYQVGTRKIVVDAIVEEGMAKSAALTLELVDASPQEWCALCNYRAATEQGVTGAGWGVKLFKWDAKAIKSQVPFRPYEQMTAMLEFGPRYSYQVQNTPIEVSSELPQDKDFLRYLASSESLRNAYLDATGRLLKKIEETIAAHQAEKKIFSKSTGNGVPPPPKLRKLTAEEEVEELAKAREHFARLNKLVEDEHVAMHAVLRKVFPFEKCWPELAVANSK